MNVEPTLICIPDISGFTRFMSEVNFELSAKVIPSLLNKIIYSNDLDLKISEIEGDAVLFYKTGQVPPYQDLVQQCSVFYEEFYKQIYKLRARYDHHEEASKIPEILGLKIILHYGDEVGFVPLGKQIKLIGEDVITAHRLLKNNIPFDEYILLSDALIARYPDRKANVEFAWGKFQKGTLEEEHLGKIGFEYINLRPLLSNSQKS